VGDALGSSLFSRREAALQGVPAFEPQAQASIDLDSFVAADHFLCRIDRVLDLAFVRELTAPRYAAEKGRPSIDPEVYFRMQLVAYFYGIAKDRRLCEEVHYNLAYRWFCRLSFDDDVPDHSSLTRIRGRLGEAVFEAVFRRIVAQCQQKGLVKDPCRVMTDATLIAADASLDSLVHNDPEQAQIEADSQRRRRGLLDPSANRRVTNRTHRSRTDPEATLAQKRGTAQQLKYKVHQTDYPPMFVPV
jgi:transposase